MSGAECRVQTDRNRTNRQETDMNINFNTSAIFQGATAAVAALVMTWVLSWSFVDSTRVARWVSAADAAAATFNVAADAPSLGRSFKAGLLQ
jgi:hypothetical protein